MSRILTQAALTSAMAQYTTQKWIILMSITEASMTDPILVALSNEDIVSNGDTYLGAFFQVDLPQEREEDPPRVRVSIPNVDRRPVAGVRMITNPPEVRLQVVLKSSPNTREVDHDFLKMRNVEWNEQVLSGELTYEFFFAEPLGRIVRPATFRALFQKAA